MCRHLHLPFRRFEQVDQLFCQALEISWLIQINSEAFFFDQLPEIWNVRCHDGYTVSAGEMGNPARTRRRGVRHYCDRDTLKKFTDLFFGNVAREGNVRPILTSLLNRRKIALGLRMISACYDQFDIGYLPRDRVEGVDHGLEALIGSPLAKRKNSMAGIATLGEIGVFRSAREDSVLADVHGAPAIFIAYQCAVGGQQHGDGIGKQE